MGCKWIAAWIGKCDKPVVEGSEYCEEHVKEKCCSCGAQATHSCEETGQFVCGEPLCGDCEHTIFPSGTNGGIGFCAEPCPEGMKRHCKKTEQKFKTWWEQEAEKRKENGEGKL